MIVKGELLLVEEEDRELYNSLPELIKVQFDKCNAIMKDIRKWFSDGEVLDNLSKFSLFYQGLIKYNPDKFISGLNKG